YNWSYLHRVGLRGRLEIPGGVQVLEFQLRENRSWVVDFPRQQIFLRFTVRWVGREALTARAAHRQEERESY
ncbi:MAG: hypothetical protein WB580_11690, partial [Candidatus Binataceae bacterium]